MNTNNYRKTARGLFTFVSLATFFSVGAFQITNVAGGDDTSISQEYKFDFRVIGQVTQAEPILADSVVVTGTLEPLIDEKTAKLNSFYKSLEIKLDKSKQKARKVKNLVSYLRAQGSPIATEKYAELIINTSENSGGDYRMIIAIMGVESGFCRANVLLYNCFGYLNGVQYKSFEQALGTLIPKITREYVRKYGTDFVSFAKAYGIHNVEDKSKLLAKYFYALEK